MSIIELSQKYNPQPEIKNCEVCNSPETRAYVKLNAHTWDIYCLMYKEEKTYSLCERCYSLFSPSTVEKVQQRRRPDLNHLPIVDEKGDILPHTTMDIMMSKNNCFTAIYLGLLKFHGTWINFYEMWNYTAMKIIPDEKFDPLFDQLLRTYGYIFVICPMYWGDMTMFKLPYHITFDVFKYNNDIFPTVKYEGQIVTISPQDLEQTEQRNYDNYSDNFVENASTLDDNSSQCGFSFGYFMGKNNSLWSDNQIKRFVLSLTPKPPLLEKEYRHGFLVGFLTAVDDCIAANVKTDGRHLPLQTVSQKG